MGESEGELSVEVGLERRRAFAGESSVEDIVPRRDCGGV